MRDRAPGPNRAPLGPGPTTSNRAPGPPPYGGPGPGSAGRPSSTTTTGARLQGPATADRDLDAARRACRLDASPGSAVALCRRARCEGRAVACDADEARVLHVQHFRAAHARSSTTNRSTTR